MNAFAHHAVFEFKGGFRDRSQLFMNYAFLRHTWCATVCPYAKLQGALFDDRTMIIAFDPRRKDECMDCRACVAICPVHIDIRNGLNAACINCAECIDTCSEKMDRRQKKGLINYFFGNPGQQKELLRQNVVMIGSITILTLGFLLYLSLARNPIDLTILPNYELKPRLTEGHEVVNAYTVAVKNKGRQDLELTLNAELQGSPLRVIPEKITLIRRPKRSRDVDHKHAQLGTPGALRGRSEGRRPRTTPSTSASVRAPAFFIPGTERINGAFTSFSALLCLHQASCSPSFQP